MRLFLCILRSAQCAALIALATAAGIARIKLPDVFAFPALRVGGRAQLRAATELSGRVGTTTPLASVAALGASAGYVATSQAVAPPLVLLDRWSASLAAPLVLNPAMDWAVAVISAAADPRLRRWPFAHGPPCHNKMDTVWFRSL